MVSVISITQLDETQVLCSCGPHCSCKWKHITHKAEETDLVSVSPEMHQTVGFLLRKEGHLKKLGLEKKLCFL